MRHLRRNPRRRGDPPSLESTLFREIRRLQALLEEMSDDVREGGISRDALVSAIHDVQRARELVSEGKVRET